MHDILARQYFNLLRKYTMRTLISLTFSLSMLASFFTKLADRVFTNPTEKMEIVSNSTTLANLAMMLNDTISISDASIIEGNDTTMIDTLRFVVERTNINSDFTVGFTSIDSTASGGFYIGRNGDTDFIPIGGALLFQNGGAITDTIKVPILEDLKTELDEYFKVRLTTVTNTADNIFIKDGIGVGTIINNDTSYLYAQDVTIIEGDTNIDSLCFVVNMEGELDTNFTFNFMTLDNTATVASGDYLSTSGIGTGSGTGVGYTFLGLDTIKVGIQGDVKVELDEHLKLLFANIDAFGRSLLFQNNDSLNIGTIMNDDTSYIAINDPMLIEGNTGVDSIEFVVSSSSPLDSLGIVFMTMDSSTTTGVDYVQKVDTLYMNCSITDTIRVAVNGDNIVELEEYFKLVLTEILPGNRTVYFTDSIGVGTIINDDMGQLTIDDITLDEGDTGLTTYTFTLILDNDIDTALTVDFATCDSTATLANTDYIANSGTLNFVGTANESHTISVDVIADGLTEIDELFTIKLSNILVGGRNIIFSDSIGNGYILNDDFDPSIADPCSCLENETVNGAKDGQFSETVTVTSQTGETWYITAVSGLYTSPVGTFPPASGGTPYPLISFSTGIAGQKLTEIDLGNGLSQYVLNGIHVDDIGYYITVTNGTDALSIGNLCHYEKACGADQKFVIPFSPGVNGFVRIDDCAADNRFVNDWIHSYRDTAARYNEMTICPNITGQVLSASFQTFDLAAGDTLAVYDGIDTTATFIAKGSGNSISKLNGGWVNSNCDPNINATGCLTFVFTTNGDNFKGAGWEAIIGCSLQGVTLLNKPDDVFASASCDSLKTRVNFRTPTISRSSSDCLLSNDDVIVTYCDFRDTLPANQLSYPVFPIGVYEVNYRLLADTTITISNKVHVSAPVLACNDTVITAIGQGCATMIRPDDILENSCDEVSGSVSQTYSIRVKTDNGYIVGTGPNYPVLDAGEGGNVTCNTFYEVSIFRTLQVSENGCMISTIDSCSGVVKLIDGIKPVFVDVSDVSIFGCHDMSLTQSMLPTPTVIDNCEIDRLVATIPPNPGGDCEADKVIQVTWTAYDRCGNSSEAIQNITIQRPEMLAVPKDTTLDCGVNTDPELTGWPMIDSNGDGIGNQIITTEAAFCNFELTFEDKIIPGTCGGNSNILRIFTLFDDCDNVGDPIFVDTQFILLRDTIAPLVNCPLPNAIGSSTNPYVFQTAYNECTGLPGTIPLPKGTDNCDIQLATIVQGIFRVSDDTKVGTQLAFLNPLEVGAYRVAYVLRDDCGNNSDVCNVYFNIADQTIPTAICSDELIISLAYGGLTITAEDISDGSFDACGIDTILIRRTLCGSTEYPAKINDFVAATFGADLGANGWSSTIEIGCCDMNSSIKVQLLVIDKSGNHNKCWLTITPENQPQSVCRDLPDANGFCDDFEVNYLGESTDANENRAFDEAEWQPIEEPLATIINNQFGNPACDITNAVCINASIEQQYQLLKEACGVQVMKRRFRTRSVDSSLYPWYYQNITVDYRPGWSITFPADTVLQCGTTDVGNIPEMVLAINRGTCDQIGWEVKDQIFETEDGSCFKILREWLVINGCQHSDIQNPFELPRDQIGGEVTANSRRTFSSDGNVFGTTLADKGYFTYTQVIIVMDSEAPIITIADVDTCIVGVPDAEPFGEADVTPGAAPYECDTLRLFSATGMDCTVSTDLDFNYEIFEGSVRLTSGVGSEFYYVVQPNRTYRVRFTASDNCGNIGANERSYTFRDCRRPSALCENAQLNLNTAGTVNLTASDINAYSYDNCTSTSDLDLRIWHAALGTSAPTNLAEVLALPTSVSLDCAYLGETSANLYVIDEAQLYSLCIATINLTDNAKFCGDLRPTIAGRIQTITGDMVEEVEVFMKGTGEMPVMITTDGSGSFEYFVEQGADYTIRPKKDINPLNGVSTFDLVLIQKHILGLQTFESPYSYIAADVNQSGAVTAFDMVITRQLILNIISSFPNNESWKFVNMAYPMNAPNPLVDGYEQEYTVTAIDENVSLDFMAVKVGDVNGNAKPNTLLVSEDRSFNGTLNFQVQDQAVQKGQSYLVDFKLANPTKIDGYQFTLAYDGLSFESWADGLVQESHFGYTLAKRGLLTTSWNRKGNTKIDKEASFFTLRFTAQKDGLLSEMLTVNSSITEAEGYTTEAELLDVDLIFDEPEFSEKTFDLYQNRPNPFGESTEVSFYLSEASATTFTIMDMAGKVIKTMKGDYSKGTHTITLERSDLPANGLLYYQLESSAGKMTKTMLILD